MRRWWSPESLIFLALWLGLVAAGRSSLLRDPGTFWHVAAGRQMLQRAEVARADAFSFTFAGRRWVADQWLAECGMAALWQWGGWDTLVVATAAVLAAVYTFAAGRLLRAGLDVLPALALLVLALAASAHQFHVRPLIVSLGFLAISFALLVDVEAGRRRLRSLAWLPPLFALWANLHPLVLAGIGTVGLVALGWTLTGLAGITWGLSRAARDGTGGQRVGEAAEKPRSEPAGGSGGAIPGRPLRANAAVASPQALLLLWTIVAACCLAVLVNPYGAGLPRGWWKVIAIPLPELIEEHAPMSLREPAGWSTVLLAAGYAIALAGVPRSRWRATWLMPLVWLVLAVGRVRNAPLLAVVTLLALADVLPGSRAATWLAGRGWFRKAAPGRGPSNAPAARPHAGWRPWVLPAGLVVVALALQAAAVRVPVLGAGWARLDPDHWPVALLDDLKRIDRSSRPGTPIFNDLSFGGLLIYHAPRLRVFVDDRCGLYGGAFLAGYDRARRRHPERIEQWQRRWGFGYALVETGGRFDRYLDQSPRWDVVGRTPAATLFRRHTATSTP